MPAVEQAAAARWGWLRLVLCAAGIYGAYLTQGMVQEDLSTRRCARVAPPRTARALSRRARPPQVRGGEGAVHARGLFEPRAERGVPVLVRAVAACAATCAGRRARLAVLEGRAEQHAGARVRGAGAQKHQACLLRAQQQIALRPAHTSCTAIQRRCWQSLASSFPLCSRALSWTASAILRWSTRLLH